MNCFNRIQVWRNHARVSVNSRTCKHLRSILSDDYEDARLKLKNPDAEAAAEGKDKTVSRSRLAMPTTITKEKTSGKKRKVRGVDDKEDVEEIADEEEEPKRTSTTRSDDGFSARGRRRGGARGLHRRTKKDDKDEIKLVEQVARGSYCERPCEGQCQG